MKKKITTLLFLIIPAIVLVGCLIYLIITQSILYSAKKEYNELRKVKEIYLSSSEKGETKEEEEEEETDSLPLLDLTELRKLNEDIVGWIEVENTVIDYPVFQSTDNSYYLRRDINRNYSTPGVIYLDYRNKTKKENQNFILFGHKMHDGTMFADLVKFRDEEFFNKDTYITFYTEGKTRKYKVINAFLFNLDDGLFVYNKITTEKYMSFRPYFDEYALYEYKEEIKEDDSLITLSTCDYDKVDGRLIIVGKQIE